MVSRTPLYSISLVVVGVPLVSSLFYYQIIIVNMIHSIIPAFVRERRGVSVDYQID